MDFAKTKSRLAQYMETKTLILALIVNTIMNAIIKSFVTVKSNALKVFALMVKNHAMTAHVVKVIRYVENA